MPSSSDPRRNEGVERKGEKKQKLKLIINKKKSNV